MFTFHRKFRALISPCDSIFLYYYGANKVYKITFLDDPTNYKAEYYGDWKLAKQAFLKHIETKNLIKSRMAA